MPAEPVVRLGAIEYAEVCQGKGNIVRQRGGRILADDVLGLDVVLGFSVDLGSLDAGFTGLATGGTVLASVYLTFVVWAVVTVWRAAANCVDKGWSLMARLAMVSYGICLILHFAASFLGRTG